MFCTVSRSLTGDCLGVLAALKKGEAQYDDLDGERIESRRMNETVSGGKDTHGWINLNASMSPMQTGKGT